MAVMGADYEEMKAMQKRCVCRQCGSELEIRMIIFANTVDRDWSYTARCVSG